MDSKDGVKAMSDPVRDALRLARDFAESVRASDPKLLAPHLLYEYADKVIAAARAALAGGVEQQPTQVGTIRCDRCGERATVTINSAVYRFPRPSEDAAHARLEQPTGWVAMHESGRRMHYGAADGWTVHAVTTLEDGPNAAALVAAEADAIDARRYRYLREHLPDGTLGWHDVDSPESWDAAVDDQMRQDAARAPAEAAPSPPVDSGTAAGAHEPVPGDDDIVRLVRKHFDARVGAPLIRERWKDGIDLDEPTPALRAFVDALCAAAPLREPVPREIVAWLYTSPQGIRTAGVDARCPPGWTKEALCRCEDATCPDQ